MVGTDAHDLGACGFELGKDPLEAEDFLRSGSGEGLDEGGEDDGALGCQLRELDGLVAGAGEGELRRFVAHCEGGGAAGGERDEDEGEEKADRSGGTWHKTSLGYA